MENHKSEVEFIKWKLESVSERGGDKADVIAIMATLIFGKYLFKRNKELAEFIKEIFDIEYLDYVVASRTMLFARVSKDIYDMDEDELKIKLGSLIGYFDLLTDKKKNKRKKDLNDKMITWLERL